MYMELIAFHALRQITEYIVMMSAKEDSVYTTLMEDFIQRYDKIVARWPNTCSLHYRALVPYHN
jgi:hypothetical protein